MKIIVKDGGNSRGEKTIKVIVKSGLRKFSCIAPSGSSKGKYEVKEYKTNLNSDIKTILKYKKEIEDLKLETFDDLIKVEKIIKSKIGGNSLYALEAALLKKGIVCSDIIENIEAIGENASFFKSGDVYNLAEKMIYAIKHREELNQLGMNAFEWVVEKRNWNNITQEYINLYQFLTN